MHRAFRLAGFASIATILITASGCSSSSSSGTTSSDAGTSGDGGSTGALPFKPSNIDLTGVDLSKIDDIDITASPCAINSEMLDSRCFDGTKVAYTTITQTNQIKIGVYVAKSWRIEPNAQVTIAGNFPIALVALGDIKILGSLAAAAQGDNPVGGGYRSTASNAVGAGPGGGAAAGTAANGAGGGSYCGVGGIGGIGAGGAAPAGGTAYGGATLVPLEGGSQGGGGITTDGGGGGGAIQLVAGTSIDVGSGAVINVGGGHGNWTGGGGGSGGAILIESPTVTIEGILAANGGGGQGGPQNPASDALPSNQPAQGSAAAGNSAAGGNGSAGATIAGSAGGNGDNASLVSSGGGGGGAGFIRVNTTSGSATITGTLSPDATTSCVSQGKLGS